jgi:hypothetical protein
MNAVEIVTFVLVFALALILTRYNRRQAHALEYVARLEEDRAAREIKELRELASTQMDIQPVQWLESMVNPLLKKPLALSDTGGRVIPEIETAEFPSEDGRRLLVSTRPFADLYWFDRSLRGRATGKGANRLSQFAAGTSLLKNRRRVWNVARTMFNSGICFDLEAEACGKALGLAWGAPTRLWFYVLPN